MPRPRIAYVVGPEPHIDLAVRAELDALKARHKVRSMPILSRPAEGPFLAEECRRTVKGREVGKGSARERLALLPRAIRWRARAHLRTGSCIADNALAWNASSIHVHAGPGSPTVGAFARYLTGLPLSVTVHSAHELSHSDIEALDEALRIFAVSKYTLKRLRKEGVEAELLYPSPKASPEFNPDRRLDRDKEETVIYIPSVPDDHTSVIDAAHRLGQGVRFWVAGPAGEEFREVVATTGLGRRFTFFDDLVPGEGSLLTATCDILLVPELTTSSDLPVDVVMAMTAGIPVVGPRARGLKEVLRDTFFVEPTGEAVASALTPLIEDVDARFKAGERNHREASEKFGAGNVDKLHRAFLEQTGGWKNG